MAIARQLSLIILSPAGIFMLGCLAFPIILEQIVPIGEPLGLSYIFAWPVILWGSVGVFVVVYTFSDPGRVVELKATDTMVAAWYLINGCFFNSMMDVFAGQFQSWQTMTQRYNELEPRYAFAGRYDGVTVLLTSCQELLIQTPCGLALYFAYHRGCSWRLPLEMVFNMWSVVGVWYFYGSEVALGFPHVHAPFTKDGSFDFASACTFDMIYKFWLGFVIFPLIWSVVGVLLALRAAAAISSMAAAGSKTKAH